MITESPTAVDDEAAVRRAPTRLSLVIPAFNEEERLADGLPKLVELVPPHETEVILVDDGSSDATLEVARRYLGCLPNHVLIRLPRNRGKGAAVRAGIAQARGEVIGYLDADMATDPRDLARLVAALRSSPIAVGSRALQASVIEKRSRHRALMNRSFSLLVSSALDLPMQDTQCGFKAFHGSVAKLLFHGATVDRFGFDVEVLNRAARLGLQVQEVPVRWSDVAGSKVRKLADSLNMLLDVGRTRWDRAAALPIQGLAVIDADPRACARILRLSVRQVDTVLSWEQGALVLFPCMAPTTAAATQHRIEAQLAGKRVQRAELTIGALEGGCFDLAGAGD